MRRRAAALRARTLHDLVARAAGLGLLSLSHGHLLLLQRLRVLLLLRHDRVGDTLTAGSFRRTRPLHGLVHSLLVAVRDSCDVERMRAATLRIDNGLLACSRAERT